MNKYNLGGHSGCEIFLIEDDGQVFVRKISKDKDYNQRLEIQCQKQASFTSAAILAPNVLSRGFTDDGRFYFDMEYIQGVTLSEYIKTIQIGKVKGLVKALVSSIIPKESVEDEINKKQINDIFQKKILDLNKKLSKLNNNVINCSLNLLQLHDWSKLTPSLCHGDMTLENIIVKDGKLYFIDFLDSFYDSWFLDIGTLLQDVQVMWSYRYQKEIDMNTVLRLIVFRDSLLDEIKRINPNYVLEVYYSLLQKLIRIYPYVKDDLTYNYLNTKTKYVLENIKELDKSIMEGKL